MVSKGNKFKKGDKVRLTSNSGLWVDVGAEGKIIEQDNSSLPNYVDFGDYTCWAYDVQLELIESMSKEQALDKIEELKQYVEQPEEPIKPIGEQIKDYAWELINKNEELRDIFGGNNDDMIVLSEGYLKIELPYCNTEWTYGVWDVVKQLHEKFPNVYPEFVSGFDIKFQYVNISCQK